MYTCLKSIALMFALLGINSKAFNVLKLPSVYRARKTKCQSSLLLKARAFIPSISAESVMKCSSDGEINVFSTKRCEELMELPLPELKKLAIKYGLPGKQKRTIVVQLIELQGNKNVQQFSSNSYQDLSVEPGQIDEVDNNSQWISGTADIDLGSDWESDFDDNNSSMDIDNEGIFSIPVGAMQKRKFRSDARYTITDSDGMDERIKAAKQDRISMISDELDTSKYGFEPDEKLDLSKYRIDPRVGCCPGCGIRFQPEDPLGPGYLPIEKLEGMLAYIASEKVKRQSESGYMSIEEMGKEVLGLPDDFDFEAEEQKLLMDEKRRDTICQRCHRLRYYQEMDESLRPGVSSHELLTPKRFQELLGVIRTTPCLVVYLVDIFDFHGSFLYNLQNIVGENHVVIAANKVDLLPKDMNRERVRNWVKNEVRIGGLPRLELQDVHLLSCKTGFGVNSLMKKVRERAMKMGVDIYVVGAANVGKSSFINHLLQDKTVTKGKASKKNKMLGQGLTVSIVPGTTLDFLRVDMGDKIRLYDTPGLILPHQLTARLNQKELKAVIPQRPVEHVTLRLSQGKSVLIGGLARVEMMSEMPFLFTFFISNQVKLHMTDIQRMDAFIDKHMGSDLLFPPFSKERYEELGPMKDTMFTVRGDGWKRAGPDIVLSGLGWISITGSGECQVKVTAPKDMLLMMREPLMPFEAWDTTSVFTGARTIKKGKKVQGRRV